MRRLVQEGVLPMIGEQLCNQNTNM
jgi:hypothetical protein